MGAAFTPNTSQPSRHRFGRVEPVGERRAAGARLAPKTGDGDEATHVGKIRSLISVGKEKEQTRGNP
jgi:hypothetical protein